MNDSPVSLPLSAQDFVLFLVLNTCTYSHFTNKFNTDIYRKINVRKPKNFTG